MIALDTSALLAVLLREAEYEVCRAAMRTEDLVISGGTLAEANIVAGLRSVSQELTILILELGAQVDPVTAEVAQRVGQIYQRWGKGRHPAALNFGDCFAYDTAKSHSCPLLFVGEDFRKTDLQSAL